MSSFVAAHHTKICKHIIIKGPDNPTSQLLPIYNQNNWLKRRGERRKAKGDDGGSIILKVVCEELCVRKLCVKEWCV